MKDIDLNADVGELPLARERALFAQATSVNVCCGFHAGGPAASLAALALARRLRKKAGAHPGYPDRASCGREPLALSSGEIRNLVHFQILELARLASRAGIPLSHAKPHGALYNQAQAYPRIARAVAHGIESTKLGLPVLTLPDGALATEARRLGLRVLREGYADRGLLPDGRLVPRGRPGALLGPEAAARQALKLAPAVDALCVHADTPGAARIARAVRRALESAGWRIRCA